MKRMLVTLQLAALTAGAWAAPVAPTRYDMANGSGQASGGQFNYWDLDYSGAGNTAADGAALSNGLGDLTDGVVSPLNWFDAENNAGSGPYVGWRSLVTPNPQVSFDFGAAYDIDLIRVHADDAAGAGGVDLPSRVLITWAGGSADFAVIDPDPGSSSPVWLNFSGLGITGVSAVTVQFFNRNQWIFIDEVQFDGTAVPLPGTLALAALGLVALRRRR